MTKKIFSFLCASPFLQKQLININFIFGVGVYGETACCCNLFSKGQHVLVLKIFLVLSWAQFSSCKHVREACYGFMDPKLLIVFVTLVTGTPSCLEIVLHYLPWSWFPVMFFLILVNSYTFFVLHRLHRLYGNKIKDTWHKVKTINCLKYHYTPFIYHNFCKVSKNPALFTALFYYANKGSPVYMAR